MSSEQALNAIVVYNKLPTTPEKAEIDRQFLSNEIGALEFYQKASAYIAEQREEKN